MDTKETWNGYILSKETDIYNVNWGTLPALPSPPRATHPLETVTYIIKILQVDIYSKGLSSNLCDRKYKGTYLKNLKKKELSFTHLAHFFDLTSTPANCKRNISRYMGNMVCTICIPQKTDCDEIIIKSRQREFSFLHTILQVNLTYIPAKYHQTFLESIKLTEHRNFAFKLLWRNSLGTYKPKTINVCHSCMWHATLTWSKYYQNISKYVGVVVRTSSTPDHSLSGN